MNKSSKLLQLKSRRKEGQTSFITLELNHKYDRKIIVSDLYTDSWNKTIKNFSGRLEEKGIKPKHITMLTDTLDDNSGKILKIFGDSNVDDFNIDDIGTTTKDRAVASALNILEEKTFELFTDEVKTYCIAVRVGEGEHTHSEIMSIESKTFEDWLAGTYYFHQKSKGRKKEEETGILEKERYDLVASNESAAKVLSGEDISRVQSILRFEASKNGKIRKLHLRVADFC